MWSAKIQVNEKLQKLNLTKTLNRSQANAVQHVEVGACPNCPGKEAARNGVYNFIARHQVVVDHQFRWKVTKVFQETRHMLSSQPQLEYVGSAARYNIPDRPYQCPQCDKKFKHMGGMMQHQVREENIVKEIQLVFRSLTMG